jgi:hypothetical protein
VIRLLAPGRELGDQPPLNPDSSRTSQHAVSGDEFPAAVRS